MKLARIITAAALVVTAGACSDGTGPGDGDNSLEASIAGEPGFDPSDQFIGGTYVNNNLSIQASHTVGGKTVTIQINLPGITTAGNAITLNQNVAGQFAQVSVLQNSQLSTWTTNLAPGTGTVTVQTLTATRAAGIFTFTGQAAPGTQATGTKAVTSGSFDIEF